jgi:hypothetical protein
VAAIFKGKSLILMAATKRVGLIQVLDGAAMKKLILLVASAALAYIAYTHHVVAPTTSPVSPPRTRVAEPALPASQVSGTGTVIRILPDDTDGDRHQRFILRLASGQTLLVAHNIDLAPRVAPLSEGDTVEYKGEYAWNEKGGVVHWTHHDPSGNHPAGWLKHDGQTFR